jgi:hypothetical protein
MNMKSNPITLAVNAAGAVALLVVGGYAAHSMLADEVVPVCTEHYPAPTRVSLLTEQGAPMTPSELQGQLDADAWGILENVQVVRTGAERGSEVLQVTLPAGSSSSHQDKVPLGGTGFNWIPDSMSDAARACLSYRVMVPEDFEFADGGMLPGLYGGEAVKTGKKSDGTPGFATRIMWVAHGEFALGTLSPVNGGGRLLDKTDIRLEAGKWHEISTETVLNTPGNADGIVRLWIDGELAAERKDLTLRTAEAPFTIGGVLTDVSFGHFSDPVAAPKDSYVQFSPFELSWQ